MLLWSALSGRYANVELEPWTSVVKKVVNPVFTYRHESILQFKESCALSWVSVRSMNLLSL